MHFKFFSQKVKVYKQFARKNIAMYMFYCTTCQNKSFTCLIFGLCNIENATASYR